MPDKCFDGMLIALLVAIKIGLKKTSSNTRADYSEAEARNQGGFPPG